ncbi:hypothetical protein [Paenibacillus tarimensis]|nr:hypothetical protein [Paenibacillus tarimensis]
MTLILGIQQKAIAPLPGNNRYFAAKHFFIIESAPTMISRLGQGAFYRLFIKNKKLLLLFEEKARRNKQAKPNGNPYCCDHRPSPLLGR